MTWKEYLNTVAIELSKYLKNDIQYSNIPNSRIRQIAWQEIEIFVEDFKKWAPEKLILKEKTEISSSDQKRLNYFLRRREKGVPLAYILGKQQFYGLEFKVNKNTLIPRPETEELVEYVLKNIKKYKNKSFALVDVGTGSGCILAAVLKNVPKNINISDVYAIDKSQKALKTARYNIEKHLSKKFNIKYIFGSLLKLLSLRGGIKYIIVANLPYLSKAEHKKLSPEVRRYEPESALAGGGKGHELICQLIDQIIIAKIDFELFLEISPTIYPKIKKHLVRLNIPIKSEVKHDLSGEIRILHISTE